MRRVASTGHDVRELTAGWELSGTAPGQCADASSIEALEWHPAVVPGTVAASIAGWSATELDERDWWFRVGFETAPAAEDEELVLALDGIATVAEVYLNGEPVLSSDSMFASHEIVVSRLVRVGNELAICCRALAPLLRIRRAPRARWRTKLVSDGNLRFFRTMLLGRAPGFAPGPPAVGPWRGVRLERRRGVVIEGVELRPRMDASHGVLAVSAQLRSVQGAEAPEAASIAVAGHHAALSATAGGEGWRVSGELTIPDVERWWPHTHGDPTLHSVTLRLGDDGAIELGRVGFRDLDLGLDLERDGLQVSVNDAPVFVRGAVWTPPDLTRPHSSGELLRGVLQSVVAAGMNMLRVPGIGCYESDEFYDLCDRLGILVWQDFMFANLDYPEQDAAFMSSVEQEGRALLSRIAGRPSLAVVCGGSEVAQQVAMLGLDPALASGPLFGELLPSLVQAAGLDAAFVPSAPWGGELPFRPNRGVANYYGVGAYLRPLEDARRAEVRFAAECLAFSNVPDEEALESFEAPGGLMVQHPAWKAGVPRDAGAGWDFEDVRDHYLQLLFDLDPVVLRSTDHERYLELSRAVTGEVMAEVFGEWRREASVCGGGLVLWLCDLVPGAGWGVLDHLGRPKVAFQHLRRALAPIAVWSTDEGLGGIDVHVANDGAEELVASLRLALYRDLEVRVEEHVHELRLGPHGGFRDNLETVLGRFVDAAWAYRFGPPAQDLIVMSLEQEGADGPRLLSQAFRLPAGRPTRREPASRFGVSASMRPLDGSTAKLTIGARRFLYGVRVHVPGFRAQDDAFSVEPGRQRDVELVAISDRAELTRGHVTALNVTGRVAIESQAIR